jgi:hypothetical protein
MMHSVSITEQTRAQIERAERVAEEARNRNRASRRSALELVDKDDRGAPELNEQQALDQAAD